MWFMPADYMGDETAKEAASRILRARTFIDIPPSQFRFVAHRGGMTEVFMLSQTPLTATEADRVTPEGEYDMATLGSPVDVLGSRVETDILRDLSYWS
jgi:hypothetical protein